jgi:hypothetical protein
VQWFDFLQHLQCSEDLSLSDMRLASVLLLATATIERSQPCDTRAETGGLVQGRDRPVHVHTLVHLETVLLGLLSVMQHR